MNEWLKLILQGLLNGLFGVGLAGAIIWIFQQKFVEHSKKVNIYTERNRLEEEKFYELCRLAKSGMHEFFRGLTNDGLTQERTEQMVNNLKDCVYFLECNTVVLGKYKKYIDIIRIKYNAFIEQYSKYIKVDSTQNDLNLKNAELVGLKDEIIEAFNCIDRLYFKNKKSRKSHKST